MPAPVDPVLLSRARSLIERGLPMQQVANMVGIDRVTLYRYGYRSARGYNR